MDHVHPMQRRKSGVGVQLLGRPALRLDGGREHRFRSRKSWALLAFLLLSDRPPPRSRLATLLFADADDPLGALRWSLAEIRRGLGPGATLHGDPVRLTLPGGAAVDADVLAHGRWEEALVVAERGGELLDGLSVQNAPAFESWLLSERQRLAGASESILHEAALGFLARGELERARGLALHATVLNPLEENHQALLIRLYRLAGDDRAAEEQFAAWTATAQRELGAAPGAAVRLALQEQRSAAEVVDATSVHAVLEVGTAAVAAGATTAGLTSFQTAVRLADGLAAPGLRVQTRLMLGQALIHALGGLDEEGVANLTEAEAIGLAAGERQAVARARAELGYVDVLRASYDRAERRLEQVLADDAAAPGTRASATTYLGVVASDRADYPRAESLLREATGLARTATDRRLEAYALAMAGRVSLLRGELEEATGQLEAAIELAEREHWLSFLPWPQALCGHAQLARGDTAAAATFEQSFARACQIGDPCWEGMAARGLALVAEARSEVDESFRILLDARARARRLSDTYVWLHVHILDALCALGRRHGHASVGDWVGEMRDRTARTGMRELGVRALLHSAALGNRGDAALAALLAEDIDSPALHALVAHEESAASRDAGRLARR